MAAMDALIPSTLVEVLSRALRSMCADDQMVAFNSSIQFTGNLFMTIDEGSTIDFLVNEHLHRTETTNTLIIDSNSRQGYVKPALQLQNEPGMSHGMSYGMSQVSEEVGHCNSDINGEESAAILDYSAPSKYLEGENCLHKVCGSEKQGLVVSDDGIKPEMYDHSVDRARMYSQSIDSVINISGKSSHEGETTDSTQIAPTLTGMTESSQLLGMSLFHKDIAISSNKRRKKQKEALTESPMSKCDEHVCDLCGKHFQYRNVLDKHKNSVHLQLKPYQCGICGKQFADKGNMNKHNRAVHLNVRPFGCEICGKHFPRKSDLTQHNEVVHLNMREYGCDICGKQFSQRSNLTKHNKMVHLNERRYGCEICGKQFSQKSNLTKHTDTVHLNLKPFCCDRCGKGFTLKMDLIKHIDIVHLKLDKQHVCDLCGKHFWDTYALNRHKKNIHLNTDRLKCGVCDKIFKHKSSLTTHYKTAHLSVGQVDAFGLEQKHDL